MGGRHHLVNARIRIGHRFFGLAVKYRADRRLAFGHFPAACVVVQDEIDHAQVVAPAPWHHCRHAVDGALVDVDFGITGKRLAWEFLVRMAKQDGVDAGHIGQAAYAVFAHRPHGTALQPGVRHRHHQLRPFGAHFRHQAFGHFYHVPGADFSLQVGFVPLHDLRRHKTDNADFESVPPTLCIGKLALQNHVGREGVCARGCAAFEHVGADIGKPGPGHGTAQERQAKVKLVVAQVGSVVTQRMHDLVGRVYFAVFQGLDLGHKVAHGVAL